MVARFVRRSLRIDSFLSVGKQVGVASICMCVCVFFFIFAYVYACVCVCARDANSHRDAHTRRCQLSYAPLSRRSCHCHCLRRRQRQQRQRRRSCRFVFFLLCHFDWKIARNWKFLLLAVRSIHSHTHTHGQAGIHTHTHTE